MSPLNINIVLPSCQFTLFGLEERQVDPILGLLLLEL